MSEKPGKMGLLKQIGWYLVPSWIAHRYGHNDIEIPRPTATSYLNGVRGLAATIVAIHHASAEWFYFIDVAYLATPADTAFIQLPVIRVLVSGHFMVALFFILSGFVLAYGPLKKCHADNSSAAIAALPASVARRPIRLFLPALPSFIAMAIAIYLQLVWRGFSSEKELSSGSLIGDVSEGVRQWVKMSWQPLEWEAYVPQFNNVCWTLGLEFQGSLAIFLMTLVLARVRPWLRIAIVATCAWDAFYNHPGRWAMFLFLVGMTLADMRHVRAKLPNPSPPLRLVIKAASYALLFLGLFCGGWPAIGAERGMWYKNLATWPTVGYEHHNHNFYWLSIGAVLVMMGLENLPEIQNFFNYSFFLYLGEISFGLYLSHYMIVHSLGTSIIRGLASSGVSGIVSAITGATFGIAASFVVADLYWRAIDLKAIKCARWVVAKMGV
jgi:peptidoglycan/LPS O-acetylase OafA/YrhL